MIQQLVESLPSSIIWKCNNNLEEKQRLEWRDQGQRKFNGLEYIPRVDIKSRNINHHSHCQRQEAGADAVLGEEYQSQTKAKHGPQNKIFPA